MPPTPRSRHKLDQASGATVVPIKGQARLIQHYQWTARTIELAVGGQETAYHYATLDLASKRLVVRHLGGAEPACLHPVCQAVSAAMLFAGQFDAERDEASHALLTLQAFLEALHGEHG